MVKRSKKAAKKKAKNGQLPFVSVCTPTFNRRPFISQIISCFKAQDYPKDKIEWIVVDDGTDKVKDLFKDIEQVKYYEFDTKMSLGKKRNFMHTKTKGEIIVYMDDDDYYPPSRISHAVSKLTSNPDALCAGSSEIYIYFKHIQKMYQFGPYGPNHATAGTFAFHRKLLSDTAYDDSAALAEEKTFLKNYTVPFVQLDPMKTILVFSHEHNTFDKRKLLENPHPKFVRESAKTVPMFVKNLDSRRFFLEEIDDKLANYAAGKPDMKPDVLKQIVEIEETRRKEYEKMRHKEGGEIVIQRPGEAPLNLTTQQTVELLQQQQTYIQELTQHLRQKDQELAIIKGVLNEHIEGLKNRQKEEIDENCIINQINSEN